ncbi:MAG TPA: hypothetical protein VJJ52_00385 [Candidatus Nanoarchaeia archaeon]|nr:hypothetical protein [Candidatus Nanoarchaeia archaeon]
MLARSVEQNLAEELDFVLAYRTLIRLYPDALLELRIFDRVERAVARYERLDSNDPLRSNALYFGVSNARGKLIEHLLRTTASVHNFDDKDVVADILEGMLGLAGRILLGSYSGRIPDQYITDCRRAIGKLPEFRNHRRIRKFYGHIAFKLNAAFDIIKNQRSIQISESLDDVLDK